MAGLMKQPNLSNWFGCWLSSNLSSLPLQIFSLGVGLVFHCASHSPTGRWPTRINAILLWTVCTPPPSLSLSLIHAHWHTHTHTHHTHTHTPHTHQTHTALIYTDTHCVCVCVLTVIHTVSSSLHSAFGSHDSDCGALNALWWSENLLKDYISSAWTKGEASSRQ